MSPGCVQENLKRLTECVFDKTDAFERSGAPTQLAAASRVPDANVIDMSLGPVPGRPSLPVGHRQACSSTGGGSHLSDTYATTATRALSRELAESHRRAAGPEVSRTRPAQVIGWLTASRKWP